MRVRDVGPRALLVEVDGTGEALSLARWVADDPGRRCADVVPGATTVLLDGVGDGVGDADAVRARVAAWRPAATVGTVGSAVGEVEVPTVYDGADLVTVAEAWGLDVAGVVRLHGETTFTAAFCGFAPGFAYLSGLPAERHLPRRATPRPRVPAGSVAVAGEWCAVYPGASPGGWHLLGRTDLDVWRLDRDPPALLSPGTRVRFVAVR